VEITGTLRKDRAGRWEIVDDEGRVCCSRQAQPARSRSVVNGRALCSAMAPAPPVALLPVAGVASYDHAGAPAGRNQSMRYRRPRRYHRAEQWPAPPGEDGPLTSFWRAIAEMFTGNGR
jgi:hypothetical protein